MKSIIAPFTGGRSIQIFVEKIEALSYDPAGNVDVGSSGTLTAYQIPVTDATDAAAILAQINAALNAASEMTVITGNPTTGAAISTLAATPDYGFTTLNWTLITTGYYTYNIYRSAVSVGGVEGQPVSVALAGGYSLVGSTASQPYADNGLTGGSTYYYIVTSVTPRGESLCSNEVSSTILVPAAPTGLTATPDYYQSNLAWTPVSGATSYNIYRDGAGVGSTASAAFNDSALTAGNLYSYTVTAVINGIESAQSTPATCTPNALAAPTGESATSGIYSNNLSWNPVAGAATYNIYRSTLSGNETLFQSGLTVATFNDVPLQAGQAYYYKFSAVVNGGESPLTTEVFATPTDATIASASPNPASINGGTLTFTGTGFDPLQQGQIKYGTVQVNYLTCSYIDANNFTVQIPGGLSAGSIQFYYVVAGGSYTIPFLVAFA